MKPSLYKILGVKQDIEQAQIKRAAQVQINKVKLAVQKKHYLFLGLKDDASTEQLKQAAQLRIQKTKKAYSILSNPDLRRGYDEKQVKSREVIIQTKGVELICSKCGYKGKGQYKLGGKPFSIFIFWVLAFFPGLILLFLNLLIWLALIVFLFIRTIQLVTSIDRICCQCQNNELVPLDSFDGKKLLNAFYPDGDYDKKYKHSMLLDIKIIQHKTWVDYIFLILGWIFGILFLLSGVAFIFENNIVTGLIFNCMSFLVLPPSREWFHKQINIIIPIEWEITVLIILFIIASIQISPSQ
ncbi:hypothetical protein [Candidatus Albibeggiatoa sp. nov. BB20]|uniref:hypothetical protein n=1 Tax=Candidatus Albibeggiatoa sp. nov. BB20 TaxID=3162723 RepID=UPI0033656660